MSEEITLFTIGCPKCKVLETKLKRAGIEFNTCENLEYMQAKGIKTAPMLQVNGDLLGFSEAITWVNKRLSFIK